MTRHWCNNGVEERLSEEIPEGWTKGRLPISEETRGKHRKNNGMHNLTEYQVTTRNEKLKAYHRGLSLDEKKILSEKISKGRKGKGKGKPPWNKGKKGYQSAWNKGKVYTDAEKKQMSERLQNLSQEVKDRKSLRLSVKLKGRVPWNKGKILGKIPEAVLEKDLQNEHVTGQFPVTKLSSASLSRNFNRLLIHDSKLNGNCCMGVIQHFHPSLWLASKKGYLSPYAAWQEDTLLERAIENRKKYKGEEVSLIDIRAGLTVGKIAPKVSIFKPALAKYLVKKYLSEYSEIFDPCSGYSGRLLGTCAAGKKYIGQDVNELTVAESNSVIEYFHLDATVTCKNSIVSAGNYQCLFTCPPYGDKENWNQDIKVLTADEWIQVCVENYKCEKYLFVVDKTDLFKENIVETLENRSHFSTSKEYVILIEK